MKKRIISLCLTFSLILPFVPVPASAALALPGGVAAGVSGAVASTALSSAAESVVENLAESLSVDEDHVQNILDYLVSVTGYGNLGHEGLLSACNRLNQIAANPFKYADLMYDDYHNIYTGQLIVPSREVFYKIFMCITAYGNDLVDGWHIIESTQYGYVIVNQSETFIFADSVGRYPYASEVTDLWLGSRTALSASTVNLATDYSLQNLQGVHEFLYPDWSFRRADVTLYDGKYTVLQAASDGIHYDQILCDDRGFPYGIPRSNTQMGNDRDYNNDKEGQPEVSDQPIVDIDGDLVLQMFPDGSWTWLTNQSYDMSTKTYYLDCSTTYNDNDTYYTYTWNYTYHIDYTSITYIGQTEEYNKLYEYYYQLPDGRSSSELTADELQALNLSVDVVPYIRSADNTAIRALYHFDGNTRDSSFWSYAGELIWNQGPSLTYMDAGPFNGALYLDEGNHDFSIKLPSSIGITDFTLQFRIYHSATMAPQTDSFILMGNAPVVNFSGGSWGLGESGSAESASPGNWSEIALIRHDNILRLYKNGLCVASADDWSNYDNIIRFVFGSGQQTYKYFDELRVLNYALAADGASYEPTAVPHDTNLTLVLPDSSVPVADEYWIFNADGNILPTYDFTSPDITPTGTLTYGAMYASNFGRNNHNHLWQVRDDTNFVTAGYADGAWRFSHLSTYTRPTYSTSTSSDPVVDGHGWHFAIAHYDAEGKEFLSRQGLIAGRSYTFSVMLRDGSVYSVPFTLPSTGTTTSSFKPSIKHTYTDLPDGSSIAYHQQRSDTDTSCWLSIYPPSGSSVDIVYVELIEGEANTGHEFVSAIVPVDTDFSTPTLAVKTDLKITGYQLGGVRPSLPSKGLVWALIESGRISSLQIYNGQAWEQVDGRIWTGSRWVPYYAYDVLLLKDLYDIVESDPTLNPIYTETGFWSWLQGAWGEMMDKLDQIAAGSGGSGGSGSGNNDTRGFWDKIADAFTNGLAALIEAAFDMIATILKTLLSLVTDTLSFLFGFISETVLGGIADFFSVFTDGSLFEGFQQTDENGSTVAVLPEGVAAVFADLSGLIMALPSELSSVIVLGIGLLLFFAVVLLI